ncbi:MAG: hypothetical protein BCS36_12710 [Desulfovibrio sp. MES5]|nr:MAG: hypothetical protein BCS36_12710 [Desulfovibrio sp. MES5]
MAETVSWGLRVHAGQPWPARHVDAANPDQSSFEKLHITICHSAENSDFRQSPRPVAAIRTFAQW